MKKTLISLLSFLILSSSFVACTAEDEIIETDDDTTVTEKADDDIVDDGMVEDMTPDDDMMDDMTETTDYQLDDYVDAVKETYGDDYSPNTVLTEAEIEEKLGLSADLYDEIYAEGSLMDTSADIFVAVKAKTDKAEEVEKILETYRSDLENNTAYSANVDKISNTEVYTNGDYVFLMILGADEFTDDGDNTENFMLEAEKGRETLDNLFK